MTHPYGRQGRTIVRKGPMYSGKTERTIAELNLAEIAHAARYKVSGVQATLFFRPSADKRSTETTHDGKEYSVEPIDVTNPQAVLDRITELGACAAIGIDEVNLIPADMGEHWVRVFRSLNARGIDVHLAGLDMTYLLVPFSNSAMGLLLCSFHVEQMTAICHACGSPGATLSERCIAGDAELQFSEPGDTDAYQVRCAECHGHMKHASKWPV